MHHQTTGDVCPERTGKLAAALRCSVSAGALCIMAMASPAMAQQAQGGSGSAEAPQGEETALDEIVVTGIRQSLTSAQAIKQNAEVAVDSITAEDIGALPDRSVTEALQRVPGISINRFDAGRDPDHFAAEGSGVVVRGLTYVRSELNGRDTFTANNGRGLSFADVPAELMGGVDVFKSPSADMIEGGIAGTVNLRTRLPFDQKDMVVAGSLEASWGDFAKEWTPTISALVSNRWETGIGEIGILASAVYSRLKTRADGLQVSNFGERTLYRNGDDTDVIASDGAVVDRETVYFPRGAAMRSQEFDRKRYGYSAALQWRSNDESMSATFQFLRSDAREAWTERAIEIATDNVTSNGDSRKVPGTELSFDDDGLFDSGIITGPPGGRNDRGADGDFRTPGMALQSNNIRRDVDQRYVTDDFAANFKWKVNDRLGLNFDYQHVNSKVDVLDAGMWMSSFQNVAIDLNGKKLPSIQFLKPTVCTAATPQCTDPTNYLAGGHDSYADPYNSFYRAAMDHIERSRGNEDAFRIDADYDFDEDSWIDSIRAGYRFADRSNTARFSTYNWGALSETWGSNGPVWLDDPVDGVQGGSGGSPAGKTGAFYFDNFLGGRVDNPLGGDGRQFYSENIAKNYLGYINYNTNIIKEWRGSAEGSSNGWLPLAGRPGVVEGTPFLPGEINQVEERNNAAYVMMRFGNELDNGMKISGNVGVRYTKTRRQSDGYHVFRQQSLTSDEDCLQQSTPTPFCRLPAEVRQQARDYANGAAVKNNAKLSYDYFLPSFNLKAEVAKGLQVRFAYFKALAAPEFGFTRNYYDANLETDADDIESGGGRPVGRFNAGNPYLKPVRADNFDLSVEWYFSNVGQLTLALFHKSLKGVVVSETQRVSLTNNGATFESIVTRPVNSDETGKVKGFEVAYQQTYDFLPGLFSGLGLSANYTYVDSSGVPQSTLSETDPDVGAGNTATIDTSGLPLQGLSKHTINITPFYEKGPLSLRLAYSWRSKFVLTLRDVIVPNAPIINEATGQLDGSVFYSINDNIKIGVQGVNLLGEVTKTSQVINDEYLTAPRTWFVNDRRFTAVLRANF